MPRTFAYGSNMDICQMKRRCPDSRLLGKGCLTGYRLAFTHFSSGWNGGTADAIPDPTNEVWGLVYELSKEDMDRLDRCEGCPDTYTRFPTSIKTEAEDITDVWVYAVAHKQCFVPPSPRYLKVIKDAAAKFQFPDRYRSYLDTIETKG